MVENLNKSSYFFYSVITIILAVFLTAGIIWAWTEPSVAPPGGNVPAPLNSGPDGQNKEGGLILNTGGAVNGLIVDKGKVGIGITNPDEKLDISGNIAYSGQLMKLDVADNFTATVRAADFNIGWSGRRGSPGRAIVDLGNDLRFNYGGDWPVASIGSDLDMLNNKIRNVSEIDPVFGIQGKKYVSYMPDFIGQKVEVVGKAQLEGAQLEIDLAKEPEGSDLWLFWQVVDHQSALPFVSPQSNASLYAYIEGSKFIIKLGAGERDAKFSYRLIATRLDHADDTDNLYDDQSVEHYIDIDALRK